MARPAVEFQQENFHSGLRIRWCDMLELLKKFLKGESLKEGRADGHPCRRMTKHQLIFRKGATLSGRWPRFWEDERHRASVNSSSSQSPTEILTAMHCRVLTATDDGSAGYEKSRKGALKKALKKAWKRVRGMSDTFGTESDEFHFDDGYSEFEESETPPRYRPDSLKSLCRATKFTEAEIKRIYRGFKAECPTGVVREETFKGIYSQFFPQGANTSQYAHYVFNTLDHNRSGILSFEDFVTGLSILARGSLEEKLKWTFSLYDINGDGCITKDEMTDIIVAIYDLMGKHIEPIDDATLKERVDRIFQKMDLNQDGVVTMEEFLDCCTSDDDISASMEVFDFSF